MKKKLSPKTFNNFSMVQSGPRHRSTEKTRETTSHHKTRKLKMVLFSSASFSFSENDSEYTTLKADLRSESSERAMDVGIALNTIRPAARRSIIQWVSVLKEQSTSESFDKYTNRLGRSANFPTATVRLWKVWWKRWNRIFIPVSSSICHVTSVQLQISIVF